MDNDTLIGWHWLKPSLCLGYSDNRKVKVGEKLTVDGTPVLCSFGLHACKRALDSVRYATGPVCCRVVLSGVIVCGNDKATATERTPLAMADATNVLHTFACDCAERALLREREAGREPDPRSWAAVETKRRWIQGEASNEELAEAKEAALAAKAEAWEASWEVSAATFAASAAAFAANAAAWAEAWEAAWEAARETALAAAGAEARAAAGEAAKAEAWEVALAAARAAEREWQNAHLETLLLKHLGLAETTESRDTDP